MLLTLRNVFHHSQSISRAYVAFAVASVSHSVLSLVSQEPRYAERNKRPSRKHLEELSVVLPDCEPLSITSGRYAASRSNRERAAPTKWSTCHGHFHLQKKFYSSQRPNTGGKKRGNVVVVIEDQSDSLVSIRLSPDIGKVPMLM